MGPLLSEYDIIFVPPKVIKGQVITDYQADNASPGAAPLYKDIPGENIESNLTTEEPIWQMFFNGASRAGLRGKIIAGAWIVFMTLGQDILRYSFLLTKCALEI